MPKFRVEYNCFDRDFNSDQMWKDLEDVGWNVRWATDHYYWHSAYRDGRFGGVLADAATWDVNAADTHCAIVLAKQSWDDATSRDPNARCDCCEVPHFFEAKLIQDSGS
jgi:hypothetical protein